MTQSLYLEVAPDITKLSSETQLPEDPNKWSDEVLQELAKQVPYLSDFDVHVDMDTVDGERGYGLGHVEVTNKSEAPMTSSPEQLASAGIRTARVPVIIRDNKLMPFDVVMTEDSRALPLTESRLRQALFRPQNFDVTSKTPGDTSMIGQLYPPFRQNNGFGGGGMAGGADLGGKTASYAPTGSSVLSAVLSSANVSDLHDFKSSLVDSGTKLAFASNPAAYEALDLIGAAEPLTLEKRAEVILRHVRPSVLQVTKLASGYALRSATHALWNPLTEHLDRGELVERVGSKIALAADMNGAVTVGDEEGVAEQDPSAAALGSGPIDHPGIYSVETDDGQQLSGSVIPNLIDVDGKPLPIALFTDGQHTAVQSDIAGTRTGDFIAPGSVSADQAQGHGVFYTEDGGVPRATLPLSLGASATDAGEDASKRQQAETFDGRQVQVSVQEYVQSVQNVDGIMLIPSTWQWIPLEQEEIGLVENSVDLGKTASYAAASHTVTIRGGGVNDFTIDGLPVEKLAQDDRSFLSQDEALFLLVGLGANGAYAQRKLAQASSGLRPETVKVAHSLRLSEEVHGESTLRAEELLSGQAVQRHRMWKEAAMIPDPTAVDAVLSLGFINPENIATFVGYLPTLDEAQRRMCELLIAARLGVRELSEGSLERAIRALEDVIQGLRLIAFQG